MSSANTDSAVPTGLEPATSGLTGRRELQLHHGTNVVQRDVCRTASIVSMYLPLIALALMRTPNGIRTRAATLKGWCPRPLDDGGLDENSVERALEIYQRWIWFHPGVSSVTGKAPAWALTIQSSSQPR